MAMDKLLPPTDLNSWIYVVPFYCSYFHAGRQDKALAIVVLFFLLLLYISHYEKLCYGVEWRWDVHSGREKLAQTNIKLWVNCSSMVTISEKKHVVSVKKTFIIKVFYVSRNCRCSQVRWSGTSTIKQISLVTVSNFNLIKFSQPVHCELFNLHFSWISSNCMPKVHSHPANLSTSFLCNFPHRVTWKRKKALKQYDKQGPASPLKKNSHRNKMQQWKTDSPQLFLISDTEWK